MKRNQNTMPDSFHISPKSSNEKTGPIPVTTSPEHTCPDACPLKGSGCYAESGPISWHWNKVSSGSRGNGWNNLLDFIRSLPAGQLWRHNQAGDLRGLNDRIDGNALRELVEANRGKRGFTYTHYPLTMDNAMAIGSANQDGFTVNVSTDDIEEMKLAFINGFPTVTIIPDDFPARGEIEGIPVKACLAQVLPDKNCANCRLCSIANRPYVIGFYAHGTGKSKVKTI